MPRILVPTVEERAELLVCLPDPPGYLLFHSPGPRLGALRLQRWHLALASSHRREGCWLSSACLGRGRHSCEPRSQGPVYHGQAAGDSLWQFACFQGVCGGCFVCEVGADAAEGQGVSGLEALTLQGDTRPGRWEDLCGEGRGRSREPRPSGGGGCPEPQDPG